MISSQDLLTFNLRYAVRPHEIVVIDEIEIYFGCHLIKN